MNTIILAAGKGTRMNQDSPKVLTKLGGTSFIEHVLDTLNKASVKENIFVVVGYKAPLVKEQLKKYSVQFIEQTNQLGTGHAVACCADRVNKNDPVLVLYGDHALIKPETILALKKSYEQNPAVLTMMTYQVDDFNEYGGVFNRFGRIIRNDQNEISAIREAKDATDKELTISEVNPAYFLFDGPWLWKNLESLTCDNEQKEYYLTDLVELAMAQGNILSSVKGMDLTEAIGVNTQEQLQYAELVYQGRLAG